MPIDLTTQSFRSTVAFALGKIRLPSTRKALSEDDRHALAQAVADHFRLCGWTVEAADRPLVPAPHTDQKRPG